MPFLNGVGPLEWIIILVIVIIIFGVGKLPSVGGALGKSIKEFREQARPENFKDKDAAGSAADKASTKVMRSEAKEDAKAAGNGSGATEKKASEKAG